MLPKSSGGAHVDGPRRARRSFRVLAACLAAAALGGVVAAPSAGGAPIDDARAKVGEAQRAADAAAARYEEAIGRLEQLSADIEDRKARIAAGKQEAARLSVLAERRAVEAYVGRDTLTEGSFIIEGGDPLDEIRRQKLLARTKEEEDTAVERLAALNDDLAREQRQLETQRVAQERAVAEVEQEQAAVQAQLQEAQQAVTLLEEQLRREQEAARARELAAAAAREASNRDNGRDYSGAFVSTGIVCPIQGAVSFIDSWGFPRHQGAHQGVDLMAAHGTPNVAVVSGNVNFKEGGTSGMGAYLHGDDGNLYYYFHLSGYEGGPRHVSQGEVIGYVGNTGDARYTAPHTHFEIHPGGGSAVNPYPSVAAVC
jgi:murein DD-endopeptidase MepM/ murein hydrolase activator NlpD